jgi:hypothetical protein
LAFTQQFENGPPHCAAVEEVFDAALIANETEAFVDEETCNGPGRHSRTSDARGLGPSPGRLRIENPLRQRRTMRPLLVILMRLGRKDAPV